MTPLLLNQIKRSLCFCSLFLAFAVAVPCLADKAPSIEEILKQPGPFHPRVTWRGDASTTAIISWSTSSLSEDNWVQLTTTSSDQQIKTLTSRDAKFTGNREIYFHHARVTDLQPDTLYQVQMQSGDHKSEWFNFKTAPKKDRPLSFLFGGDSRSDSSARREVNRMLASMLSKSLTNDSLEDDILCLCHGGDYVATGTNLDQWIIWLTDHEETITDSKQLLPVVAARGNHDRGPLFNEIFDFPVDDKNYYNTDFGPEVRMITLNTETSTAGDQAKWLGSQLKSARSDYRFVLTQYHKPAYPAVKGPSGALKSWVPLFEKYNIDLACEADGHNIKRTVPIRDGKIDPTGIVYIGEGGLGVPQRTPKTDRWFLQAPGMADKGHNVQLLTLNQKELQYRCVLLGGEIRDTYIQPVRTK
ncbi:MAG: phosphatase [Blastopirellula sp.]|nr:MAG: phosphatase [Blastopirellula sp.]